MAQIITVDFPARKVMDWGLDRFAEASRRCSAEAARQPDAEIAAALRRLAASYKRQGGAGQ